MPPKENRGGGRQQSQDGNRQGQGRGSQHQGQNRGGYQGGGGRGQGRGGQQGQRGRGGQGGRGGFHDQQQQQRPQYQESQNFPPPPRQQQQLPQQQSSGGGFPAWGQKPSQPAPTPASPAWGAPKQEQQPSAATTQESPSFFQQPKQQKQQPKSQKQAEAKGQNTGKASGGQQPQEQLDVLTKEISQIKLSPSQMQLVKAIPNRRDPKKAGTLGRNIRVQTNMMPIKFNKNFPDIIIHYDVTIDPDKPKYLYRKIFETVRATNFPKWYPAFDGKKNAYATSRLPNCHDTGETYEVTVQSMDGKDLTFKVTLKFANELDMSWLKVVRPGLQESERDATSLQALNVIISMAAIQCTTPVGRSYFSQPKGTVISLGGGMDLWHGLFQSAVIGWKPFLNVDVAHKGFPKPQPVIELIKDLLGEANRRHPRDAIQRPNRLTYEDIWRHKKRIEDYLKSLLVYTEVNGVKRSRQVVQGLIAKNSKQDFFALEENKNVSVFQYFKDVKNYTIQYPDLPTLWIGSRQKNNHVPLEVCHIMEGQALRRKLDESQTAEMVKRAATGTYDRKNKIYEQFDRVKHNDHECLKHFGVSIHGEFETVPARILDPPMLQYNRKTERVNKGVWRFQQFLDPTTEISRPGSWTIVTTDGQISNRDMNGFKEALVKEAQSVGISMGDPLQPLEVVPLFFDKRLGTVQFKDLSNYFDHIKGKGVKFVFVIFSDYVKNSYSIIKQVAELKIGMLTQCIKKQTLNKIIQRGDRATTINILQKVNAKLNGKNHQIVLPPKNRPVCLGEPCMIVGADVTHPSPDSKNIPSIAAVAASHDPNAFHYNIELRFQDARMEIITDLKEIMKKQLMFFKSKTNYQPSQIVFYRDGVSEGQFHEVMAKEITAIQQACTELNQNYKPNITFLVVQKRHHIRLFPTSEADSDDAHKNYNVKAGTIVDTEITHPSHIDFYLVSHASIQGTARPTKYRCLHDDSKMTEDQIEQLTYFLCHMFTRCTRSVSYPTPTYYAHLAAFRARAYIQDIDVDLTNLNREQQTKLTIEQEFLKKQPMFFV